MRVKKIPKEILDYANSLTKKIEIWNREYYENNSSVVNDEVYDAHVAELNQLQKKYPKLKKSLSVLAKIGFKVENKLFTKVQHLHKMFSIQNAFSENDLHSFSERVRKVTGGKHSYMVQPKFDGLSLSLVFRNFRFAYAATRGDGLTGEIITPNVKAIQQLEKLLLQKFPYQNFELRGEAFVQKKDFVKLNQQILKEQQTFLTKICTQQGQLLKQIANKLNFSYSERFEKEEKMKSDVCLLTSQKELEKNFDFTAKKPETFWQIAVFTKKKTEVLANEIKLAMPKTKILIGETKNFWKLTVVIPIKFNQTYYMNPRNLAAGTLRQLNAKAVTERKINTVFYDLFVFGQPIATMKEKIQIIKNLGFSVPKKTFFHEKLSEVLKSIQYLTKIRENFSYQLDGVVVKINENKYLRQLGETEKFQHNAIAYKFPAVKVTTQILAIFPTVGRTGKITYNAQLQPVFLNGSIVSAASLHNFRFVKELDLRVNDWIEIQKAGDIIPQILRVIKQKRNLQEKTWNPVNNCPACQSALVLSATKTDQFCLNDNCEEKKIQFLIFFASLGGVNIKGFSEAGIRLFFKLGLIRTPIDFYRLEKQKKKLKVLIQKKELPLFANKSLNNLFASIEASRNFSWARLLGSLNIPQIGQKTAQILANKFSSPQSLRQATKEELIALPQIGDTTVSAIERILTDEKQKKIIEELYDIRSIPTKNSKKNVSTFWQNKVVVFTGKLPFSRQKIANQIIAAGGLITTQVTKNCDICIAGEKPGSKLEKAKINNVKIVRIKELESLLKIKFEWKN